MILANHILRAVLLASAAGSALQAACPRAGDLASGIVLQAADGNAEIHREMRPDWIHIQVSFADGDGSVVEFCNGLYLHGMIPVTEDVVDPGGCETFATAEAVRQWEASRSGRAWSDDAPGDGVAKSGTVDTVRIGDRSLDRYDVMTTFAGDPVYEETYTALPSLGIALLIRTADRSQVVDYHYASIDALL